MALSDTIAAIATAPGKSGVAVVRVSGPDAFAIALHLTGRLPAGVFPCCRMLAIRSADASQILDRAVVLAFKSPHSYTGEDVVEFQCHGGAVTPRRVLEAIFAAGARLARRGEFTERAFLNGRLDYDQAESVLDLINARTDQAADAALEGLAGRRQRELRDSYEEALSISSELEHALDVDESELPPNFLSALAERTTALTASLRSLVDRDRRNGIMRNGALVVIAGEPNVGKSSLLNALLGENRAIVSDTAGTTRDSIETWLDIGGFPVRLVDTAGLRHGDEVSEIEAEGVRRSEALVKEADVILALAERPENLPIAETRMIRVLTKSDLRGKCSIPADVIEVSSLTGDGLETLKTEIASRVGALEAKDERAGMDKLLSALGFLNDFSVDDPVLAANAVRSASLELGQLIGSEYSSDLLDRLFSRFCVGK